MHNDTSPGKWAESITLPLIKGKGDALDCLRLLVSWPQTIRACHENMGKNSDAQARFVHPNKTTTVQICCRQVNN